MHSIVVGYDGSAGAKRALERAARLAGPGATVTVVTVVTGVSGGTLEAVGESERAAWRETLEAGRAHVEGLGIQVRAVEGIGSPARVIDDAAKEADADLIVVGSRGLGAGKRLLLGSVSTKIVHESSRDVLVVR